MRRGFTVLELIVAIVVMGFLAATAIPTAKRVVDSSRDQVALSNLRALVRSAQAITAIRLKDAFSYEDLSDAAAELGASAFEEGQQAAGSFRLAAGSEYVLSGTSTTYTSSSGYGEVGLAFGANSELVGLSMLSTTGRCLYVRADVKTGVAWTMSQEFPSECVPSATGNYAVAVKDEEGTLPPADGGEALSEDESVQVGDETSPPEDETDQGGDETSSPGSESDPADEEETSAGLTGDYVTGIYQKSLYSYGGVAFTNEWKVTNSGDVYIHDDFNCNSQVLIEGNVFVLGNADLTNDCRIGGTLWVSGDATLSSNPVIMGDLWAGGGVYMTNTALVAGDLRAGGDVVFTAQAHVSGSIEGRSFSSSNAENQAAGKDIRVSGTFTSNLDHLGRGAVEESVCGGRIFEGAALDPIVALPEMSFRSAAYPAEGWAGTSTWQWGQWVNANAQANSAPSWAATLKENPGCSIAGESWSMNGPLVVQENMVLDARKVSTGCAEITFQSIDLRLAADLTVYLDAFSSVNGINVSSSDGQEHTLRVVVPGQGAACSKRNQIKLSSGTMIDEKIKALFYTPSKVNVNGTTAFSGQIVAGCIESSGDTTVRFSDVSLPDWG